MGERRCSWRLQGKVGGGARRASKVAVVLSSRRTTLTAFPMELCTTPWSVEGREVDPRKVADNDLSFARWQSKMEGRGA